MVAHSVHLVVITSCLFFLQGPDVSDSNLLAEWRGQLNSNTNLVVTEGNEASIVFHSDDARNDEGFKANWVASKS